MKVRRLSVLLGKEFLHGPKNFIFIWTLVVPIVISLVVSLVFGSLFSGKSKLGIMDEGGSKMVQMARELSSITVREYNTASELKRAVESGAVDSGVIIPQGFDGSVTREEKIEMTVYVWGESLAKDRAVLGATIVRLVRDLSDQEAPVALESIYLGDEKSVPWNDRLLPFIVLMGVFFGGIILPATLVINEKEKRTLQAAVVTPATLGEIFISKGILGLILSMIMGVLILIINQVFIREFGLLILLLFLGGVMAITLGLTVGALVKNLSTLFAVWKVGGILLFGPVIIYMFPKIPQWIGNIFPTYYLLEPIVSVTQKGGRWPDVSTNIFILIAIDVLFMVILAVVMKRLVKKRNGI